MPDTLPPNSPIQINTANGHHVLTIPFDQSSGEKIYSGLSLVASMCMYVYIYTFLATDFAGLETGWFEIIVSIVLLAITGWTAFLLYMLFQDPVPQTLTLLEHSLLVDTGRPPVSMGGVLRVRIPYRRQRQLEYTARQARLVKLQHIYSKNQLSIGDLIGGYNLAAGVSNADRQWLYNLLKREYG